MNHRNLIPIFCSLTLIISACKKDVTTGGYLKGTVIHKYTKAAIPGLEIQIEEVRPGIFSSDRTLWDKTTTNSKGEFTLKLQSTNAKYQYEIQTILPSIVDTTKVSYQFMPTDTSLSASQLVGLLKIELKPSGYIATAIWDGNWDSVPGDKVIITSPYVTKELIRGNDRVYFYVEPSKFHQFSWYCVKNGVNGQIFSKQIYVPNFFKANGNASVLFYRLSF